MPTYNTGSLISMIGGVVAIVLALLTATHVVAISADQNTAVVLAATSVGALLFYLAGILHMYGSDTFDVARFTAAVTAALSAVFGILTSFHVFAFSPSEQALVLADVAALIGLGVGIYAYLNTHQHVTVARAAAAAPKS